MTSVHSTVEGRLGHGVPQRLIPAWVGTPWAWFLTRKLGTLVLSFVFLVIVTFSIVLLIPGDAARAAAGPDASLEVVEATRQTLGLNDPVWQRFLTYVGDIFSGTLGTSFRVGTVSEQIAVRAPYTLVVAGASIVITLVLAFILGVGVTVLTRNGRRTWLAQAFSWVTAVIDAVPVYVRGTLLIILFALTLGVLPAGGAQQPSSYVLPIVALAIGPVCSLSRIVRREAESALQANYIRTTEGWRLSGRVVYLKYLLPNVVTAALTLSGLMLSGMIGGALVMEQVFSWPGLGTSVVNAILTRDYPVIQGTILVLGMVAVIINILIDVALAAVDPRHLQSRSDA
ncbi:MAG: ABC transporter permease [Brevibacterium yomogidense]|uniref:ABC transporter permease n=1 Tax=Brevibacterium TaxID=1696 RepID=UPI000B35CCFF|nr:MULTISPECIES: ABC transporter permease [Brevibacterium]SMX90206.1 peptide/nickel transport system permease protein [Brevibacterium sp. Mu109]